ncbi:hypothetical protein [Dongia sedimenti]|uniref:Uncharacterized protein n=1 Tax=Dongia sedimenti TaxID=3064282 RepID=A0ABU0YKG2_9PROT|nr:hypothetical protein [Rhodospirillaceae bacterium R-7]
MNPAAANEPQADIADATAATIAQSLGSIYFLDAPPWLDLPPPPELDPEDWECAGAFDPLPSD